MFKIAKHLVFNYLNIYLIQIKNKLSCISNLKISKKFGSIFYAKNSKKSVIS